MKPLNEVTIEILVENLSKALFDSYPKKMSASTVLMPVYIACAAVENLRIPGTITYTNQISSQLMYNYGDMSFSRDRNTDEDGKRLSFQYALLINLIILVIIPRY